MEQSPSVTITVDIGPASVEVTLTERVFVPLDPKADILPGDRMALGYFDYLGRTHVIALQMEPGVFPYERIRLLCSSVALEARSILDG